jgi:hypothetical protein
MRGTITMLALLLAGCAPVAQSVYTSDGRQGVSLNCTFDQERLGAGNWGICYAKAGELCGAAGYDVLQKSDDVSTHSSWGMYGGSADTINQRTMVIACKGGKKAASAQPAAGGSIAGEHA